MHSTDYCVGAFVALVMLLQVSALETIVGLYGETIEVPCSKGAPVTSDYMFIKWKYDKDDGTAGDLLVKKKEKDEAVILASDEYRDRVNISDTSSLLIAQGTLEDQKTFTCMVVTEADVLLYPIHVLVHKKPLLPKITEKAKELEDGKLTRLGECVSEDANPAANITWSRNGIPLVADGKMIVITPTVTVDKATGLSTTTSELQYTASKVDVDATFTCSSHHSLAPDQVSAPETFTIHYPTEKVKLQVVSDIPLKEGDNVTLKCKGDGNPPPTSYNFHIKGKKVTVENSDTYTLTGVTRDSTGEYKCSPVDNDNLVDSKNITVSYLDVSLSPSGTIVRRVGENVAVTVQKNASGEVKITWTKDNTKLEKQPRFDKLKYADSGNYVCEVSTAGLTQRRSFRLVVEGVPVIKRLDKRRGEDGKHKVLICEAEGSPKPMVLWSVNGTSEESPYVNGKITHKIVMVPTANLTVSCTVSNDLGHDMKVINVSSLFKEEKKTERQDQTDDSNDQAKLIVGIVVGLLLAAAVVGLVYWIYTKKSKQGSWKTGEKETGTSEESKKLEENNHKGEA
ncbi:CD166 antigen homolog isoform X1 [Megalops cyprinoides]|uniref:CD166 antigen homolog isoform X1 n=1 Tax=Megalops cyprinoides TaxID=118141 RepID=UPI001864B14E|nr:CD166 antigen homolog isoform X1 [Megalops cyprinoides]